MSHKSHITVNFSNNNEFDDIEELIESTDEATRLYIESTDAKLKK
jgi:hypothetical protein